MDDILDFNLLYRFNNTLNVKIGDILVSNPLNVTGLFYKTVILITAHDEFGTTGFILNKQTNINYLTLYDDINCENVKINYGGPVNLNISYILYFSNIKHKNSYNVFDNLYYSTDVNIINNICGANYKICLGCSIWGPQQLKQEMLNDRWAVYSLTNLETIFSINYTKIWNNVLLHINSRYKIFINYPINPSLN